MKKLITTLALILALAMPLFVSTGCKTPAGKALDADAPIAAQVDTATHEWFQMVVKGLVTTAQEIEMRNRLTAYQKNVANVEAIATMKPVDLNALAYAQVNLDLTASAVIAYQKAITITLTKP
jgi:urease accessory protein UreF